MNNTTTFQTIQKHTSCRNKSPPVIASNCKSVASDEISIPHIFCTIS